ncbi:major facilitator superfamily domain-containing protein [Xylariaceae sp. FL0594]|nr:major facilitator superfamily domain-containing protein [Xylariaceae sp. FL0594]
MRHNSMARMARPKKDNDETIPPFPYRQMLVLAICRLCEPIAFMGIFPYVYFMIEDFHITDDSSKISFYAGLVTSAFTFAEFSTAILWGRLSDRIGRKPVLITGLVGTAVSVIVFGFAPSLPIALLARAVGGFLNGNIAVLQTTIGELVTHEKLKPRAFTIMPLVWCLGSIVGPMIGGALARPCISYPTLFSPGTIWDRHPYLLPNLFSAFVVLVGVINGLLFLEETHPQRKMERDRGLELGDWILSKFPRFRKCAEPRDEKAKLREQADEARPLLDHDEQLPQYRTNENSPVNSPRLTSTPGPAIDRDPLDLHDSRQRGVGVTKTFTPQVILNIASFGILAFHTMTFDSLLPVFLATAAPDEQAETALPFKFAGGFGLDVKSVGIVLSIQGAFQMFIYACVIPKILDRYGPLRLFRFVAIAYFPLYLVTPYLVLLPTPFRMAGLAVALAWKSTFANIGYPSNAILITQSAPSPLLLGTINGVGASTASLSRCLAPTISGMLYAVGLKCGYSGLAWWFSALISISGAVIGLRLKDKHTEAKPDASHRDPERAEQLEGSTPTINAQEQSSSC